MKIIEFIRSLGFGAIFTSGIFGLIYTLFPHHFPESIHLNDIMTLGALLGAGGHRAINTLIELTVFKQWQKSFLFHRKLRELRDLKDAMKAKDYNVIQRHIIAQYFLDSYNIDEYTKILDTQAPSQAIKRNDPPTDDPPSSEFPQ